MQDYKLLNYDKGNVTDWLITIGTCLYALTVGVYPNLIYYTKVIALIGIMVKVIIDKNNIYFDKHCKNIIILMGLYFSILFLSSILSTYHIEGIKGAMGWLDKSILLIVAILFINNKKHLNLIFSCFVLDFVLNSLYIIYNGIYYHDLRGSGIISSCMPTGTIMFFLFAISLTFTIYYWQKSKSKFIMFLIFFCCSFIAILFNGTRGVWLGAMVLFIIILLWMVSNRKKMCLIGGIFLLLTSMIYFSVPYIHNRTDSIINSKNSSNHERFLIYNSALNITKDYPILGIGTDNFKDAYQKHYISSKAKEPKLEHAHNIYLESLAENGIIGFLSFIVMLGYFMYICWKMWKYDRQNVFALLTVEIIMVVLLHGMTEYVFAHIIINNVFWLLLGVSLKLAMVNNNQISL
ncbi:O-antigen ligase family protein [Pectinatus frisingensis]|uniref:O-antigen ligase family protein n=1 Tax=Pectinatus frisingensis TaxID=865 RepID=UPI0018C5826D|nr:O-antigen ligase family protein [Pectinatus frisingensis]